MEIEYDFNYQTLEATITNVTDANGDVTFDATVEHDGLTFDVTKIGKGAFEGCSMTSITIPEGVVEVGYEAFKDCPRLKTVNIPASVNNIKVFRVNNYIPWYPAFYNTRSLQEINVAEGSLTYAAEEGILYSADKNDPHLLPEVKEGPCLSASWRHENWRLCFQRL